jgi:hypothetical protein
MMPLGATLEPCQATFNGVGFAMYDGPSRVYVLVTHEVLDAVGSPAPQNKSQYAARCESYRILFETTASKKYDAGHIENEGPKIRITAADIAD